MESFILTGVGFFAMLSGAGMFTLCHTALEKQEAERDEDREMLRQFRSMEPTQQLGMIERLSPMEIARLHTEGVIGSREAELAAKQQDQRHELARDKQAQDAISRDLLIKVEADTKELEKKRRMENPTADEEGKDRLTRFNTHAELLAMVTKMAQSDDLQTQILA